MCEVRFSPPWLNGPKSVGQIALDSQRDSLRVRRCSSVSLLIPLLSQGLRTQPLMWLSVHPDKGRTPRGDVSADKAPKKSQGPMRVRLTSFRSSARVALSKTALGVSDRCVRDLQNVDTKTRKTVSKDVNSDGLLFIERDKASDK